MTPTIEVTSPFRARTLKSLSGHMIRFEKNQTKSIPGFLLEEAVAIGLVPSDEVDVALGSERTPIAAIVGTERDQAIREAIQAIQRRTLRDDWTGTGNPSKDVVSSMVKFKVDQREVTRVFKTMKDEESGD